MSPEPPRDLPEAADGVVYSRISEGAVLLSTDDEVYYGLNETGARAWEALREVETFGELCSVLTDAFPEADRSVIESDVSDLLAELERLGLLVTPAKAGGGGDG